jgi:hypothetical protein
MLYMAGTVKSGLSLVIEAKLSVIASLIWAARASFLWSFFEGPKGTRIRIRK